MSVRPRKKNDTKISFNRAYQVVLNPLVTEKATQMSEFNKIVFSVPLTANKLDIKLSIEKIFSVQVKSINTILLKGKVKRFKGVLGRRPNIKKAIVTLAAGNTIDLSVGV
jgi:large subunit ribosomal protein L23